MEWLEAQLGSCLENHSLATHSKVFDELDSNLALCVLRYSPGSISFASSRRCSSRLLLASFSETSGYTPSDILFSLPAKRYLNRHHLPPLGDISRYRPPPSNILCVLFDGLAFLIAVTVREIGGNLYRKLGVAPNIAPSCPRMSIHLSGRRRTMDCFKLL